MPTQVPVDFRFKRGVKRNIATLGIEDGSLIFTLDTGEFYIDIDGKRLFIDDIVFYDTETEIKNITTPADKLYIAKNTRRMLVYDRVNSKWIYLSNPGLVIGTCDTAGDVPEKVITINSDFILDTGVTIAVKYDNTNTASNCTLNVNNTGAKSVYYNGSIYTESGTVCGFENGYVEYMYDGTYWVWMGASRDKDSEHGELTPEDIKDGTNPEPKLVSAATFNTVLTALKWSGTLEEYEDLPEKDSTVLYFIHE